MKLKLQFIVASIIMLAISISGVYGQANLTFSGGSGTPLSVTLQQSITYTINNSQCINGAPYFFFDEAGNPFSNSGAPDSISGTITYSINGAAARPIGNVYSGVTANDVSANDFYLLPSTGDAIANGSTVTLSAGTLTTTSNVAAAPPANGSFPTFITNSEGVRCSNIIAAPTAAPVSISGRVLTNYGRGIKNVSVTLTDPQGNERTAQTTSFGYYHFDGVTAGETVTLAVKARKFKFVQSTIVRTTNDSISDADFVSEQ